MPATSCSLVVAMVREAKLHPDGHEPSEGNISQFEPLKEYPTHDDHWLHSCSQFEMGFL